MANVAFTVSPAPGVLQDMVAVIYNTLAPAAEITRLPIPYPHTSPVNLNFTNLAIGTYIVKIHETPGGGVLGNLRHDFWVDAAITNQYAYTVKTFQVGLGRSAPYYDPAHEDTDYINPDLDGLEYTVFKPGYGPLDWSANITPYTGGGFSFTDGQQFYSNEIYTILVQNLIQNTSSSSPSNGFPNGIVNITGDDTFVSGHYSKILQVFSVNNCTLTISSLATIPDNTVFSINTQYLVDTDYEASFRYIKLALPVGTECRIGGAGRNPAYFGRGESWTFVKNGSVLYLVNGEDSYRNVGQIVYTFGTPPQNSRPLTGGWFLPSEEPRLFNEYVNLLPSADLGTGVVDTEPDAGNRTKWIINGGKFWVPDWGGMFARMADPDGNMDAPRRSGVYQSDAVGPANVDTIAWTGVGKTFDSLTVDGIGFLATQGDGGSISNNNASGTNRNTARTNPWPIISPAGETRPKNVAVNAYVLT